VTKTENCPQKRINSKAKLTATFNIGEFVDRIYLRRIKASHGGSHLETDSPSDLISDTLLLTAICLICECDLLGLDAHEAVNKYRSVTDYFQLPLKEA
jgi:hypothetical protein